MLLGRNGAGKSTTLRTIVGLWQASAGRIEFDGAAIHGGDVTPGHRALRHRLRPRNRWGSSAA